MIYANYNYVMKLGGSSKINKHNQIIIPHTIKNVLKINDGDNVGFWIDEENGKVELFTMK